MGYDLLSQGKNRYLRVELKQTRKRGTVYVGSRQTAEREQSWREPDGHVGTAFVSHAPLNLEFL